MSIGNAETTDGTMRDGRNMPAVRRRSSQDRRRAPAAPGARHQRGRLGSIAAGGPDLGGTATSPAAGDWLGDPAPQGAPRPPRAPSRRLLGAALAILLAIIAGLLVINRLPWNGVAGAPPAATLGTASPPDSLVRAAREGIVGPRDYFRAWHHAGGGGAAAGDTGD